MNLSRKEFLSDMRMLFGNISNNVNRSDNLEIDKIYFDYSEEDKRRFDSYKEVRTITDINNELSFLIEDDNDEKYLLVSNIDNCRGDDIDFERIESSFAELAILCKNKSLHVIASEDDIYNNLFVYEDVEYRGHCYEDVKGFFKPFFVYRIDKNSVLYDADIYCIYAYFRLGEMPDGESRFSKKTEKTLEAMLLSGLKIPYYNILLAICANQWCHAFLETYRVIEHVYPAIAFKELDDRMDDVPLNKIAYMLEEVIAYRPSEEDTLREIFDEIEHNDSFCEIINEFDEVRASGERRYRWYYRKVRNQIVHYRVIHEQINLNNREWDVLFRFNIHLIMYLYKTYGGYVEIENCSEKWKNKRNDIVAEIKDDKTKAAEEQTQNIVIKMLKDNLAIENISKYTSWPEGRVRAIAEKQIFL